jgi:hypothetical protein
MKRDKTQVYKNKISFYIPGYKPVDLPAGWQD